MKHVAIVYHYFAHYRLPILNELTESQEISYTLISGTEPDIDIKTIDMRDLNKKGVKTVQVKNSWLFNKKFLWQKGLIKALSQSHFDAVIFLGSPYHLTTWIALLICKFKSANTYLWMHGVYKTTIKFVDLVKLKGFYKLANGYFLYGNRAASIMSSHGLKPSKMHIVYNSLNYSASLANRLPYEDIEFQQFRIQNFGSKDLPVIIFIGRLNKTKKINILLEAQSLLLTRDNLAFNCIIIGDGDQRQVLEDQVRLLSLFDYVKFTGALYDEKNIADMIIHADLCVTPGDIGLTAIHALSYGTPVISHNNLDRQMPEVESIIPGNTGDLFEFDNVEDLANKVKSWISNHEYKSEQLMNDCYSIIDKHYNPKYQAHIFESVLK